MKLLYHCQFEVIGIIQIIELVGEFIYQINLSISFFSYLI